MAPGASGVKVIARDRSTAYADGARQGSPTATQVADRFHLMQNLREALDQVFSTHSQAVDAVNGLMHQQPSSCLMGRWPCLCHPRTSRSLRSSAPCSARLAGRRCIRRSGPCTTRGGQPRLSRSTWGGVCVQSSATSRAPRLQGANTVVTAERVCSTPINRISSHAGMQAAILQMRLFRDLRQRGYVGGYGVVAAYARRLRPRGSPPGQRRPQAALPSVAEPLCQPLTPRRAAWLVLRRETRRTEAEAQQLAHLRAQDAEVAAAIDLAEEFATLVRQRQPAQQIPGCTVQPPVR